VDSSSKRPDSPCKGCALLSLLLLQTRILSPHYALRSNLVAELGLLLEVAFKFTVYFGCLSVLVSVRLVIPWSWPKQATALGRDSLTSEIGDRVFMASALALLLADLACSKQPMNSLASVLMPRLRFQTGYLTSHVYLHCLVELLLFYRHLVHHLSIPVGVGVE
jgi:hypothetical protein